MSEPSVITITTFANESEAQTMTNDNTSPGKLVSDYVQVSGLNTNQGQMATLQLMVSGENLDSDTSIYYSDPNNANVFRKLDTRSVDGMVEAQIDQDGVYSASTAQVATFVTIATAIFVVLIIVVIIVATVVFFRVRRDKWHSTKEKVSSGFTNIKRSFAKKV